MISYVNFFTITQENIHHVSIQHTFNTKYKHTYLDLRTETDSKLTKVSQVKLVV